MKKRVVIALLTGLVIASLAGCGTKTEVTGQEIPESSSAVESEAEADGSVADESTSEEVIGDNADEPSDFAGAENESIVLYEERGEQNFIGLSDSEYYENENVFTAENDIPLYDGNGFNVGYIKANVSVITTESAENIAWSRFENPINDAEYDYLYIMNDYLFAANEVIVTKDSLKDSIINEIYSIEEDTPTVIDVPTSDMEVYEFRMYSNYNDSVSYDYDIWFYCRNNGFTFTDYMTYAIETIEDNGDIVCRIYYKDSYEDWLAKQKKQ